MGQAGEVVTVATTRTKATGTLRRRPGSGKLEKVPWREDLAILKRVELVADLMSRPGPVLPVTAILEAVNKHLEQQGRPTVTRSTIYDDMTNARSLLRERVPDTLEKLLIALQQNIEETWRNVKAAEPGKDRAPLLSHHLNAIKAIADLTGVSLANMPPTREVILVGLVEHVAVAFDAAGVPPEFREAVVQRLLEAPEEKQ